MGENGVAVAAPLPVNGASVEHRLTPFDSARAKIASAKAAEARRNTASFRKTLQAYCARHPESLERAVRALVATAGDPTSRYWPEAIQALCIGLDGPPQAQGAGKSGPGAIAVSFGPGVAAASAPALQAALGRLAAIGQPAADCDTGESHGEPAITGESADDGHGELVTGEPAEPVMAEAREPEPAPPVITVRALPALPAGASDDDGIGGS